VVRFLYLIAESYSLKKKEPADEFRACLPVIPGITPCIATRLPVAPQQSRISGKRYNKDKDKPGTRRKKTSTGLRTGKKGEDH
jgi:hypothetical protein